MGGYARRLLDFRAKHDLTQVQLAKILGVNVNMVHRYENGLHEPTQMRKIKQENRMKQWEDLKNADDV